LGPDPVRRTVANVDIASRNLAPASELDALLSGTASLGKTERSTRVAVPPFAVRGADDLAWMGEASAELVSAALMRVPNVSVLERGEIKRSAT
jgi:PPE-repeat protein